MNLNLYSSRKNCRAVNVPTDIRPLRSTNHRQKEAYKPDLLTRNRFGRVGYVYFFFFPGISPLWNLLILH